MSLYGSISYWDERYTKQTEPFDWHQKWHGVKHVFTELNVPRDAKVLNVGCGTSTFSEEMSDNGYKDITNIDASNVCIKKMQEIHKDRPSLKFLLMDVCNMKDFLDESFDLVIDKACFDSIVCSDESLQNCDAMLTEISRILKPNGFYVMISHAQPAYRLNYIQKDSYKWQIAVKTVKRPMLGIVNLPADDNVHYIYVCKKDLVQTENGNSGKEDDSVEMEKKDDDYYDNGDDDENNEDDENNDDDENDDDEYDEEDDDDDEKDYDK